MSDPMNPDIKKLLQPILDQAGAVDLEVVTSLRTEITKLKAQLELERREHRETKNGLEGAKANAEDALAVREEYRLELQTANGCVQSLTEQLRNAQDAQSDLTRERDEVRADFDRVRAQLRSFGADEVIKTKEEIRALIAQTEIDLTELKMEVDKWIQAKPEDVTMDQKEIALNTAMHLAGMFQAMRVAAELWEDGELALAQTKIDEADQFAGVVRATLMGLRLGWKYRETLREIVADWLENGILVHDIELRLESAAALLGLEQEDEEDDDEEDDDDGSDESGDSLD